jgi:superfamily II DNA or RNA helicase
LAVAEGDLVICRNELYERYGAGRVLMIRRDQAKVEYVPGLFTRYPLFSHTKILRIPELERVPDPLELAAHGQWSETWRFDLKQMAARFLTGNKGGQLSNARTELLPHQVFTAHEVVKTPRRRFLLADEVGLGKTIEVGMIWQALYQRGQADRALIICPAGLTVQWQEEMQEKFGRFFKIYGRDFFALNPRIWDLETCAIASLDCLKRPEHKAKLLENRKWDLIVFDEAHRLSARDYRDRTDKTLNFRLAEDLKEFADALLLVTATPHQGEEDNSRFINLMNLLIDDIDFSALTDGTGNLFAQTPTRTPTRGYATGSSDGHLPYQQLVLRTPKLKVTDADGRKVFVGRQTHPLRFEMFADEARFYKAVTGYITKGYAAAERVTNRDRRLALGFVLSIFQKLAASSAEAIKAALYARKLRLQDRHHRLDGTPARDTDSLFGDERFEGEQGEKSAPAQTVGEFVENEVQELEGLLDMPVRRDRKLVELLKLVDRVFEESERGDREKVLIFTEYRNTQTHLARELRSRFGEDCLVLINGDLDIDQRRASQSAFRDKEEVRFLVSTEAGGEGINLQFCHVCVNYDLPWNPMRIEQRVGRLYRYGQKKVVQVYNFRNGGTVEDQVYGYLERRLGVAAHALSQVTGEDAEDVKTSMLGHLQTELDYNQVYKRTLVDGDLKQSEQEIKEGIERAKRAYEIATTSLFRDASGYSFDRYEKRLKSGLTLDDLRAFTDRYLQAHRRRLADRDGVLEFLTPEPLRRNGVKERYEKTTFDREVAIRDPGLTFLALGHEFVDAMLQSCGQVDFGGENAVRRLDTGGARLGKGWQFNFVIRNRVMREEGEEFLFDFHPVFVTEDGQVDEQLAQFCAANYSIPADSPSAPPRLDVRRAYQLARAHLENTAEELWDWEEDATLLGVAAVAVR